MSKPRVLSGEKVISVLKRFGFVVAYSKGSHCKLTRVVDGHEQVLVVPRHRELDRGTQHAIYRQATVYISEKDLKPHFFT